MTGDSLLHTSNRYIKTNRQFFQRMILIYVFFKEIVDGFDLFNMISIEIRSDNISLWNLKCIKLQQKLHDLNLEIFLRIFSGMLYSSAKTCSIDLSPRNMTG